MTTILSMRDIIHYSFPPALSSNSGVADPKEGGKTEPVHGKCFGHVSGGDA